MQVSGQEDSFPGWELEFPHVTVGLRGRREARRLVVPGRNAGENPCRARRHHLGRDFRMGTPNVEIAHLNNLCSPAS